MTTLLAAMVDNAVAKVNTNLSADPAEQANALITFGSILMTVLEQYNKAQPLFDRALEIRQHLYGPDSAECAEAIVYQARADYWIALPLEPAQKQSLIE